MELDPDRVRRSYGTDELPAGGPAIRKQLVAAVERARAQLDAWVPQPVAALGDRAAPDQRRGVARSVDRIELHPRRLHTLCGRAVLATNRHPAQRNASGPTLSRKQEHGDCRRRLNTHPLLPVENAPP
jgi:hypothetical protein